MDTADRDCRLYNVFGILQAGNGCFRNETFLRYHESGGDGQRAFHFVLGNDTRTAVTSTLSASVRHHRLKKTEGRKVRRDSCFTLSTRTLPYRLPSKRLWHNGRAARATLATAALTYNSNKELYAQKVVSEFSLKTAENAYLPPRHSSRRAKPRR